MHAQNIQAWLAEGKTKAGIARDILGVHEEEVSAVLSPKPHSKPFLGSAKGAKRP